MSADRSRHRACVSAPPPTARARASQPARVQRPSRMCASTLGAEVLQRRERRRRLGVAERAQRLARDVVRRRSSSRSRSRISPSPRSIFVQDLEQPVAALAARRALAARLVRVEVHQVHRRPHHARRLVHDDDAGGAEHRSGLLHGVEAGRDVELIGQQDRHRRSAGNHRLELVAVADAAGAVEDQLLAASCSSTPRRRPASSRGR